MLSQLSLFSLLTVLASAAPTKRFTGVQISHNNDLNQVRWAMVS
jgi:hypothetical protein